MSATSSPDLKTPASQDQRRKANGVRLRHAVRHSTSPGRGAGRVAQASSALSPGQRHLAGLPAGEPSLIQHMYEIAPVLVSRQGREIAGRPELLARFVQETLPVGELVADRTLAFGRCVDTLAGQRSARLDV